MSNLRSRTVSGLGWSGATQLSRQTLRFVVSVLLARLLTPDDFGLIAMILVFTGFAQLFREMGFGSALIYKQDAEQKHFNSVFWVNIAVGLVITLIVIAISPMIARFYDEPELQELTFYISFNFVIGSFTVVQSAILRKKMAFRRLFLIETVAVLVSGTSAITLAILGFGVWSLVAQSLLLTIATVIMMWLFSPWRPSIMFDRSALNELMQYSSNLLGFNVLNYWTRNLDNLLIGRFLSSGDLGLYSRAYSLMLLPLTQVTGVITRVMFPALASIQDNINRTRRVYLRSIRAISFITFPMMIGLFVVADSFILVLYGEKWAGVIPLLRILCLVGLTQSIGSTVGWIYTSQGRTDIMFKWGIAATIIRGIAFVIGLRWGVIGVATSYLISGLLLLYPAWTIPSRLIDLSFSKMVGNLSGSFYAGVAMGAVVFLIGIALPVTLPHWALLAIQVSIGAILYLALAHFFHLRSYAEIRMILAELSRTRVRETNTLKP